MGVPAGLLCDIPVCGRSPACDPPLKQVKRQKLATDQAKAALHGPEISGKVPSTTVTLGWLFRALSNPT